jgi:hypothetical protein
MSTTRSTSEGPLGLRQAQEASHLPVDGKGEQIDACGDHLYIPELLGFAEVLEAGEDWVAYKNKLNGKPFINCAETGMPPVQLAELFVGGTERPLFTSRELHACEPHLVGDPTVTQLKKEMDAKVVS